jgi:ankyrin repeat protein
VLLPPSISVCTPPSSPILEAANALPHLQLSPDSATAAVREFGKDTDNEIEDIMLSLSLEDSAAPPTSPKPKLQHAPTVSTASNVQFRNFWTRFRSDTKSGSPYACEMSLKSQASLQPSLFSVASRGRSHVPSFSTPPLSKVMDEWERNDLSRTQYPCANVPSGAEDTICPHVTTLGQEHSKTYVDEEPAGVAVNTELQEDDQGNHFFFEEDKIPEEDEVLKKSEPRLQGLVEANSIYRVGDGELAALVPLYPLSYVAERGRKAAVQLLEKAKRPDFKDEYSWKPLWGAAARGREAVVRWMLATGAELDSKDKDGRTPLSWAAVNGHEVVVQLLLNKGAKLDSEDKAGQTPLSLAAANGCESVVQMLLNKGAKLDSKDEVGQTPLSWAAANGCESVVQMLLIKGAELDSEDWVGRTPLSWAAANGCESVVQMLLATGAVLDSKDKAGRTPLSWAAANGCESVVQMLLARGAELDSKDKAGRTPLSLAIAKRHRLVVQMLLNKGARLDPEDKMWLDGVIMSYIIGMRP